MESEEGDTTTGAHFSQGIQLHADTMTCMAHTENMLPIDFIISLEQLIDQYLSIIIDIYVNINLLRYIVSNIYPLRLEYPTTAYAN